MITDRQKFTTKLTLYGMSSFHFHHSNQFISFLWAVHSVQETYLPKFSAVSDIAYCNRYATVLLLPGDWYGTKAD